MAKNTTLVWVQNWTDSPINWDERPAGWVVGKSPGAFKGLLRQFQVEEANCPDDYTSPEGEPFQIKLPNDHPLITKLEESGDVYVWGYPTQHCPFPKVRQA